LDEVLFKEPLRNYLPTKIVYTVAPIIVLLLLIYIELVAVHLFSTHERSTLLLKTVFFLPIYCILVCAIFGMIYFAIRRKRIVINSQFFIFENYPIQTRFLKKLHIKDIERVTTSEKGGQLQIFHNGSSKPISVEMVCYDDRERIVSVLRKLNVTTEIDS